MRGITLAALGLLVAAAMAALPGAADDRYGTQKVVYHINYSGGMDGKIYVNAMRSVQDHIDVVGADNIDVKVVLHGPGVYLLRSAKKDDKLQSSVAKLKSQKVVFYVSNTTLVRRKISYTDDLFDVRKQDIVPSGVAELTRLQHMGYSYIKL